VYVVTVSCAFEPPAVTVGVVLQAAQVDTN
jgi:hypothetical protein